MKKNLTVLLVTLTFTGWLSGGCATSFEPIRQADGIIQPDIIVVHEFAVSQQDIELDSGFGPRMRRDISAATQSDEEIEVGKAVAKALSTTLVRELNEYGINAVLYDAGINKTERTVTLKGLFTAVDEGSQTQRAAIGFGMGRSKVRTRGYVYQGDPSSERQVAEFDTETKSSLKPGMGPAGAAGASLVASTATTAVSEKFFTAVEKDAKRTAKELANRIKMYYIERGWL